MKGLPVSQEGSILRNRREQVFLTIIIFGAIIAAAQWFNLPGKRESARLVLPSFEADLQQCHRDTIRVVEASTTPITRQNPRAAVHSPFVLRNAQLLDGDGSDNGLQDIWVANGTITKVAAAGSSRDWTGSSRDLGGRYLTPGIVDIHSHLGVRSLPQFKASEDTSEIAGPYTPQMHAMDGFDPSDEAIPLNVAGGTTSVLVLTGATQVISGQGMAIKLRTMPDHGVQSMLIHSKAAEGESGAKLPRYLKMACGENPKSLGNPKSRPGEAFSLREAYSKAKALKEEQDEWCAGATEPGQRFSRHWSGRQRYPTDLAIQPLVDALRGDVRVNVHCYKTEDIEMELRNSEEFGYNITALHHASETWRMVDRLKQHPEIVMTVFAGEGGFKPETMHTSASNGALMHEAGFAVAMHTDHPALNGQFPAREAGVMHNFGLPTKAALASMFSVPAKAMGIDDRVGFVRPGYDADLVIWDDHPLELGASPLQVWIDGAEQIKGGGSDETSISWTHARINSGPPGSRGLVAQHDEVYLGPPRSPHKEEIKSNGCSTERKVILRNVNTRFHPLSPKQNASTSTNVVIEDGRISCVGDCEAEMSSDGHGNVSVVNVADSFLMPGLAALTPMHGLTEMLMDDSTSDGYVDPSSSHVTHAAFGLAPDHLHVARAQANGISVIITPPRANGPKLLERWGTGGFIKGVSTAFSTGVTHAAQLGAYVKLDVAMHVSLGDAAKSPKLPTISGQIQALMELLTIPVDPDWTKVANGDLPLVVHVESADAMAQLVLVKRKMEKVRIVINGGSEAWIVADALAEAKIPVILAPWRAMPLTWEFRRAHHGIPETDTTAVQILLEAGVEVAIAAGDDRRVRDLWWEASWAAMAPSRALPQYHDRDVLAMDLLGSINSILGVKVDASTYFSLWQGNPFSYGAKPVLVYGRGELERCYPSFD